jgi:hypothetical protein
MTRNLQFLVAAINILHRLVDSQQKFVRRSDLIAKQKNADSICLPNCARHLFGEVMKKTTLIFALLFASTALGGLDTATYVSHDGGGSGMVTGDMTGVNPVTIEDVKGGDLWNGGDQFMYLHDSVQERGNFSAMVRVVSQTSAIDGRWGKAGIQARASLDGNSQNVMTQVYPGNGSQFDAPSSGADHNPVPARAGGRTSDDGQNGFERPIFLDPSSGLLGNANGEVANDFFRETVDIPAPTSPAVWLRLDYTSASNIFMVGVAEDVNGAPDVWNWADPVSDVPADGDGWYVGIGYSAHGDFAIADGEMHGVTFDNYSIMSDGGGDPIDGDFNADGAYDCADIDALTADIAASNNTAAFDLTGDGSVNLNDRDAWLSEAGEANLGPGKSYLVGDGNLDGVVDVSDFGIWNGNKFTSVDAWCSGDFTADGVVDVSDFAAWNGSKFTSSDAASPAAVPEPLGLFWLLPAGLFFALRRKN